MEKSEDVIMRGTCIACRHSAMLSQLGSLPALACRRRAPRPMFVPVGNAPGQMTLAGLYPPITPNNTCGEYEDVAGSATPDS